MAHLTPEAQPNDKLQHPPLPRPVQGNDGEAKGSPETPRTLRSRRTSGRWRGSGSGVLWIPPLFLQWPQWWRPHRRGVTCSFFTKRGVAFDTAAVDDQALKELEEKYIIARDLDADTVLSKIQDLLGLVHKEDSIVAYEGLSYQLPSRDPNHWQHEYDPLLRQLCLRRGKVDCCTVGDPRTSRWAKVITAVLSMVQKLLLAGGCTSSDFMRYRDELFETDKKTVDDALLDICCLLECTRTSLSVFELNLGTIVGPLTFTRENGEELHVMAMAGAQIYEGMYKIAVKPGAEVTFILVVQRNDVFEDFAIGRGDLFLREFSCVIVIGGDGQPDITTRDFLRKLKDSLSVPVYALVDPDPEGLSVFCTYKFGSSQGPFDNVGLDVPDIKRCP